MKTRTHLLWPALLLLAAGCHKKDDAPAPAPTPTALLTAHAWKDASQSLVINGYEGTRAVSNAYSYTFGTDGKLVGHKPGKADEPLANWQLTSGDTRLLLTPTGGGGSAITYELFEVTASKLAFGDSYDQATIQQQVAAGSGQVVPALLLSASQYTFPANTPTFAPSQVTSLQLKNVLSPN